MEALATLGNVGKKRPSRISVRCAAVGSYGPPPCSICQSKHITQRTTNPFNDVGILHPVRAPIAPLPAAKRSHCYDTVYDTAMRDEPRLEPTMPNELLPR